MPTQAHARSRTPRGSPPPRLQLAVRPVTAELWPALEDLFGRSGASNGCWCMDWRIGGAYRETKDENGPVMRRELRPRATPRKPRSALT